MTNKNLLFFVFVTAGVLLSGFRPIAVRAAAFSTSYTDGGTWNTVYVQGFSPALNATPDPGFAPGDTVHLDQFQFFKSGFEDSATDFDLAILDNIFYNFTNPLTTASPELVGISSNRISSTAALAEGDPLTFTFDSLPLTYGNDYGAVFVQNDGAGNLTPVLVSALTTDYIEEPPGSGTFVPITNYGTQSEFQYSTSNFIRPDGFFNSFEFAGDANFVATFNVPNLDFDTSGMLDCGDIDLLVAEIAGGGNDPTFDLTGDGEVDLADRDAWLAGAGAELNASGEPILMGDANLNGTVDGQDFLEWNANKFTHTAAWCSGDFTANGTVDGQDFLEWNANKFMSADGGASAVPEPSALGLLAVWLPAIAWARVAIRRRRGPRTYPDVSEFALRGGPGRQATTHACPSEALI